MGGELRITKKDKNEAEKLIEYLKPIQGEKRVVEKCHGCGHLQARRYIPYGLGGGIGTNMCICQATSRNTRTTTILEKQP